MSDAEKIVLSLALSLLSLVLNVANAVIVLRRR